ncbi:PQQ-dependent sugar dehydrogenase [soil metagenome]|nr:PQQ-dependent sugar dehydrogenase [Trueperaceae bacterium]
MEPFASDRPWLARAGTILALCTAVAVSACTPVPEHGIVGNAWIPVWRSDWNAAASLAPSVGLATEIFASGFERPVGITPLGDGSDRLVVIEQAGRIMLVEAGREPHAILLDLTEEVACCGEEGLLGFAAHPDFATNGAFYVHYSTRNSTTVVERYLLRADDRRRGDESSALRLIEIAQPGATHNGGHVAFGPDRALYLGVGDGGHTVRGRTAAQSLDSPYGKILRLDVDWTLPEREDPSGAPSESEVWALGLRNPWRFSFDRATGDMFIGDVGQNAWEEVDLVPAGVSGANFGWPYVDGYDCRRSCETDDSLRPIIAYAHDVGCAITGGYVYRGERIPHLEGTYLYGDFCSGRIWGARQRDGVWVSEELMDLEANVSSFGEDDRGEIYFADYGLGVVYLLIPITANTAERTTHRRLGDAHLRD